MKALRTTISHISNESVLTHKTIFWCALFWLCLALVELVPDLYLAWSKGDSIQVRYELSMILAFIYRFFLCLVIRVLLWRFPLEESRNWLYHAGIAAAVGSVFTLWTIWGASYFQVDGIDDLAAGESPMQYFVGYFLGELVLYLVIAVAWSLSFRIAANTSSNDHEQSLTVKHNGIVRKLSVDEIVWIESMENYVVLHTGQGKLLHRSTLAATMAVLQPAFIRVHRSRAVNKACIQEINQAKNQLQLTNGDVITVGRRRLPEVTQHYLASS